MNTEGYGPGEDVLKKAMAGKYLVQANYYGSYAPSLTGAVTLQVDVFTNYGRENEQRRSITLRLTQRQEVATVGEVDFAPKSSPPTPKTSGDQGKPVEPQPPQPPTPSPSPSAEMKTLQGEVVASTPNSLVINVMQGGKTMTAPVTVGLKTTFILFRRPAVGEKVEVEDSLDNGVMTAHTVKVTQSTPKPSSDLEKPAEPQPPIHRRSARALHGRSRCCKERWWLPRPRV